jgi:hypothetical protein
LNSHPISRRRAPATAPSPALALAVKGALDLKLGRPLAMAAPAGASTAAFSSFSKRGTGAGAVSATTGCEPASEPCASSCAGSGRASAAVLSVPRADPPAGACERIPVRGTSSTSRRQAASAPTALTQAARRNLFSRLTIRGFRRQSSLSFARVSSSNPSSSRGRALNAWQRRVVSFTSCRRSSDRASSFSNSRRFAAGSSPKAYSVMWGCSLFMA